MERLLEPPLYRVSGADAFWYGIMRPDDVKREEPTQFITCLCVRRLAGCSDK
jgi:hypothetical protein